MAPEVMMDQPSDTKSDIWSLGILLYTLIASRLPFESGAYDKPSEALAQRKIPYSHAVFRTCAPECLSLLRGMLEQDPTARYSIDDVINDPWVSPSI